MSQKAKAEPAKKRLEFYYDNIRFNSNYQAQFGQAHNNQLGLLECSTIKHPTQYSACWVMGSPVVFVKWATTGGKVMERHIPWEAIMVAEVIKPDDEAAPLAKRG